MLGELVRAVLERALEAELTAHLGYERHERAGHNSGNSRNGAISKKVQTGIGPVGLGVPRDRAGTFEPVLIPKRSGRVSGGLDDMIISLYAHGMSVRDILHHLEQVYGTKLSAETVSFARQQRALSDCQHERPSARSCLALVTTYMKTHEHSELQHTLFGRSGLRSTADDACE